MGIWKISSLQCPNARNIAHLLNGISLPRAYTIKSISAAHFFDYFRVFQSHFSVYAHEHSLKYTL